jgi:hypothetical protein
VEFSDSMKTAQESFKRRNLLHSHQNEHQQELAQFAYTKIMHLGS